MPPAFHRFIPGDRQMGDQKKNYVRSLSYANAIRPHWLRDYVPLLNKRVKWHTQSDFTLKAGDGVWAIHPDSPRGYYPPARIVKLHYGQDSCARSALDRTPQHVKSLGRVLSLLRFLYLLGGRCNANVSEVINEHDWTKF